jgi:hypothetical protein
MVVFGFREEESDHPSLVESVFPNPDQICAGEYITIYEFLLSPDFRNDPQAIVAILEEFSSWSQYMLAEMRKRGFERDSVAADPS